MPTLNYSVFQVKAGPQKIGRKEITPGEIIINAYLHALNSNFFLKNMPKNSLCLDPYKLQASSLNSITNQQNISNCSLIFLLMKPQGLHANLLYSKY